MASSGAGDDPRKNNNMGSSGAKDKPPVAAKPATHRGRPIQQGNNASSASQAPHSAQWARWSNIDPLQQWRPSVSQSSQISSRTAASDQPNIVQQQGSEGTPLTRPHQPSFQHMQPAPSNPPRQGSQSSRDPNFISNLEMTYGTAASSVAARAIQQSSSSYTRIPNPAQAMSQQSNPYTLRSNPRYPSTFPEPMQNAPSWPPGPQSHQPSDRPMQPVPSNPPHQGAQSSRDSNFISDLEMTYGRAASSVAARAMQQQSNPYTLRSNQQQLASINRQESRGAAIVPIQATQQQLAPMYRQNYPAGPSATQAMQQQSIPGYTRGSVEELEFALEHLALPHGRPHFMCTEVIWQLEQQIEEAEAENYALRMEIENQIRINGPIIATIVPKKKTDEGDQEGV